MEGQKENKGKTKRDRMKGDGWKGRKRIKCVESETEQMERAFTLIRVWPFDPWLSVAVRMCACVCVHMSAQRPHSQSDPVVCNWLSSTPSPMAHLLSFLFLSLSSSFFSVSVFGLPSPFLQLGQSAHGFLPNLSGIYQTEAVNVTAFFFFAKARRKECLGTWKWRSGQRSSWSFSVCAATRTMEGMSSGAARLSSTYKVARLWWMTKQQSIVHNT